IEHRAVRRALGAAARARGGERRRDVFHLRGPQGHRLRRAATAYAPGAGRCRTARGRGRVALPDGPAPLALAPGAQSAAIRSAPSVSMIAPMMMRYHNTVMIHRFFTHPWRLPSPSAPAPPARVVVWTTRGIMTTQITRHHGHSPCNTNIAWYCR